MMTSILVAVLLASVSLLQAGPGHDHPEEPGGGAMPGGPVELTEQQAANLRLETVEAELRRLRSSSVVTGPVTPAQVKIRWDETQKAPAKVRAPRKRKTS